MIKRGGGVSGTDSHSLLTELKANDHPQYQLLSIAEARLTLESGVPYSTADQLAKTTLFYTPIGSGKVSTYNLTDWNINTLEEISIAVPATTDANYDVFLENVSGTLTLSLTAWADAITRATALTTQNGIDCKSGDVKKKYVGSIRTTSVSGQCEFSEKRRLVWNRYNRRKINLLKLESTGSWSTSISSFRASNNNTANAIETLCGEIGIPIYIEALSTGLDGGSGFVAGIGVGTTTTDSSDILNSVYCTNNRIPSLAKFQYSGSIGYHKFYWLEKVTGGAAVTFYGNGANNKTGIRGEIEC